MAMSKPYNKADEALKRVWDIRGFYMHVMAYICVNVLIFIGWYFEIGLPASFWDTSLFITIVFAGIGLFGHWLWLYGYRLLFSKACEQKLLQDNIQSQETQFQKIKQYTTMGNISFEEQAKYDRARKRVKSVKGFYKHLIIYVVINTMLLAMKWFKLDEGEEFFTYETFSTAFFWGIGLFFHAFSVFGTDAFLGRNWEERKMKEYLEKRDNGQPTSKWE
jgi:2TM domain